MSLDPPPARRRVVAAPARRPPAELRTIRIVVEDDPNPDASYLDQKEFAERRAEYRRGGFRFVGVRAIAEVVIAETTQTLTSAGLYGIESDVEEEELGQIANEEWSSLRVVLKTVGVSTEQLPLEVEAAWIEWRT